MYHFIFTILFIGYRVLKKVLKKVARSFPDLARSLFISLSLSLSQLLLLFLCLGLGLDDDNFRSSLRQCERKRIRKRIDNLVEVAATRAQRSEKRNYTMQKMGLFYRVLIGLLLCGVVAML